jgi:thiamine pyrophosphate-dependent acetolactate synthase large subunit-like protein
MLATAFGGIGRSVTTAEALDASMKEMLSDDRLWVLNVHIDPFAAKKAQTFGWLSTADGDVRPKGQGKVTNSAKL